MAVKGHHFFLITERLLEVERFKDSLERTRLEVEDRLRRIVQENAGGLEVWRARRDRLVAQARARCNRLNPDFKTGAIRAFEEFRTAVEQLLAPGPLARSDAGSRRS
jgi:hypothetical protein